MLKCIFFLKQSSTNDLMHARKVDCFEADASRNVATIGKNRHCEASKRPRQSISVVLRSYLILSLSLSIFLPFQALAEETYEVTATSLASNPGLTGGSESTISASEIEDYQETFLNESLPYTPSVITTTNGTQGRVVDFSIRGARTSQNLVLLDGIYVNDPASGGNAPLADFLTSDLEKVEVLPGPQSLAYGPGALGGVIQLIPKRGKGTPSLKAQAEGGSFKTGYGTITGQGEEGALQFSSTLSGFTRGPDTFTNPLHGNRQGDRFKTGTTSTRLSYALTDNWETDVIFRYSQGKVQFDAVNFSPQENAFLPSVARNFSTTDTLLSSFENKWGGECVDHSLKFAYTRIERKTRMPDSSNKTIGEHPVAYYKTEIQLNPKNALQAGLEGGQERAKEPSLHKRNHGGIYGIYLYKPFNCTKLMGGLRGDQYESSGGRLTYSVGVDLQATPTTTLRTSYGTNFKPPNLSDLFQKDLPWQVANPSLKPEESRSFEAGIDQTFLNKKAKISLTGFLTRISHVVLSRRLSNGKWQRYNGGHRDTKGLELAFNLKAFDQLEAMAALTLTRSRENPGGTKAAFIPPFKGAAGLLWAPCKPLKLFIQGFGVSSRKDTAAQKNLSPYALMNLGGEYEIHKHISLFGRIENVTGKHYEEVYGYGSRGRAFYIGIKTET